MEGVAHGDIPAGNGVWRIALKSRETVEARWLIDATGRGASLARRLGVRKVRDEGLIALWRFGLPRSGERCNRTLIEAVPEGSWYGAVLPDDRAVLSLHVRPDDAHLAGSLWLDILRRTRFLREFFPAEGFVESTRTVDAGGGRLAALYGDAWIACGDAAISFDPLSSQGIYTAMYSGMMAARAIAGSVRGDALALANYAAWLDEIRRVYRDRLADSYAMVERWPESRFWVERLAGVHGDRPAEDP